MNHLDQYAYGLWGTVIANIALVTVFTYSVFKPKTKREWRTLGSFMAFLVALFSEMYGAPLTIYFLTSVLGNKYPVLDPYIHLNGHLWVALTGGSKIVYYISHPLSNILIILGLIVISLGWKAIHSGEGKLVDYGLYKYIRHPQYTGFFLMIIGFLIQWPTIITLIMAPILFTLYVRLAKKEEGDVIQTFGKEYLEYKERVPAFFPNRMVNIKEVLNRKNYKNTNTQ